MGDRRSHAAVHRAEADQLRNLPVSDAARLIEAKRADLDQQRRQVAEQERQISEPFEHDQHRSSLRRDGPTQGL